MIDKRYKLTPLEAEMLWAALQMFEVEYLSPLNGPLDRKPFKGLKIADFKKVMFRIRHKVALANETLYD